MANLNDYIFEEVLNEEFKLNRLSNKLGKAVLSIHNALDKIEDSEKYDNEIEALKRIRVEILLLEKKYYANEIDSSGISKHLSSYIKAIEKTKKALSDVKNTKLERSLDKLDDVIKKMKNIKHLL